MDRFDWIEIEDEVAAARQAQEQARVKPYDGPTYYRAARQMRESGHFKPAVDYYERAVGFQPHDYASWVELIDTLVRARQLAAADDRSHQALDAYRQVRVLYASRALVLAHLGQYREAKRHLEVSLDSDEPWYAKCVEAEILLRQDVSQRTRALACLEEAVAWAGSGLGGTFRRGVDAPGRGTPRARGGAFRRSGTCEALRAHRVALPGRLFPGLAPIRPGAFLLSARDGIGTHARPGAQTPERVQSKTVRADARV